MSTTVDQTVQIAELQSEVRNLRRELATIRSATQDSARDGSEELPDCLKRIIEMTHDLIPGEVRVDSSADPEHPDVACVVFRVAALNRFEDVSAVIDTEIEWHRRARAIFPEATCHFRLAIE